MTDHFHGIVDRFVRASADFERRLRLVRDDQWGWPTPCAEWDVRQLVNHMARGNVNYRRLARGGSADEFLRLRDTDALGAKPIDAYVRSVRDCATEFARPDVSERELDYPLGRIVGAQALAVRTTDSVIHTWDLARALGLDERLDDELVTWIETNLAAIYAGLAETPIAVRTTYRFFAPPVDGNGERHRTRQDRLLRAVGRDPASVG